MKNILVISLCLSMFQGFAQTDSTALKQDYFEKTTNAGSRYDWRTQFVNFRLSTVEMKLQGFFRNWMDMSEQDAKYNLKNGKGTITMPYVDGIAANKTPAHIYVQYTVEPMGNEFIVKSVKLTGDANRLRKFFVQYWNTTLNFDNAKQGEAVMNYYKQDRVGYSPTGITITKIK